MLFRSSSKLSAKIYAKSLLAQQLQHNWNELIVHKPFLQTFFPSYPHFQNFLQSSHKFPSLFDVISGHLPTYSHLYRMNWSTRRTCPICSVEDTMQHFLFSCFRFHDQRKECLQRLGIQRQQFNMEYVYKAFQTLDLHILYTLHSFVEQTIYQPKQTKMKKRKFEDCN